MREQLELLIKRKSAFEELLSKDNSVSIYHRNLQILPIEMFLIKNNMDPEILTETFQDLKSLYNLKKNSSFSIIQEGRIM